MVRDTKTSFSSRKAITALDYSGLSRNTPNDRAISFIKSSIAVAYNTRHTNKTVNGPDTRNTWLSVRILVELVILVSLAFCTY